MLRKLQVERLEARAMLAGDVFGHNSDLPEDANNNGSVEAADAIAVVGAINGVVQPDCDLLYDVNNDGFVSAIDVLKIVHFINHGFTPPSNPGPDPDQITETDAEQLLDRAAAASASDDAIIAIVDRSGRVLGVRAEEDVLGALDEPTLVFAIDGAVAKARTAAFFSSNAAPLPSRTIRFISQSTVTQREVEANPNVLALDSVERGPGFVAPIGLGGHFPPEVLFTPPVDLFAIEHQSRDGQRHPGADGIKGTTDDIILENRFNVDSQFIPDGVDLEFPESYGVYSGRLPLATSRGIATLPGGIPLYKNGMLVGGIGVFFPGDDGYATHEQNFVHASQRFGVPQSELDRTNADRVLESEWIAFAAAGGSSGAPENASVGQLNGVPPVPGFDLPFGRIDLVGITLEIYGPHPTQHNNQTGISTLLEVGRQVRRGLPDSGENQIVTPGGDLFLNGKDVAEGWLVTPHDSAVDDLSAADVRRIIEQGVEEAERVRAAIRLTPDGQPGERTRMVLAVADRSGEVLGLFRMPDATIFSIDVSVAKARNTAYYADATEVRPEDLVDDNNNGIADVPAGVAFTNRTFRFLAEPRFPTGSENSLPSPFSILRDPGINPATAENIGPALPASVYSSADTSVLGFDAFNPSRNFRDPDNLDNQNGIVFFPGSSPLYQGSILVGGFGVSGDGVDQDDVVTVAGQEGFAAPLLIRADQFFVRGVRLPYQKFLRNPYG